MSTDSDTSTTMTPLRRAMIATLHREYPPATAVEAMRDLAGYTDSHLDVMLERSIDALLEGAQAPLTSRGALTKGIEFAASIVVECGPPVSEVELLGTACSGCGAAAEPNSGNYSDCCNEPIVCS